MTDATAILKNITTNNLQEKRSVAEFCDIVSECLNELKALRKELTKAYIISNTIVIKENGEYLVENEKKIREEKKQSQDLDVAQKQEEKILQNIYELLSNPQKERCNTDSNEHIVEEISSKPKQLDKFFQKISNLVYKLISIFTSVKHNNISSKISSRNIEASVIADPVEAMQRNIETLKLYQEELKSRTTALQQLEKLQQEIKKYDDRIVSDPQEHNKPQFTKKLLEVLKSRNHTINKDHIR